MSLPETHSDPRTTPVLPAALRLGAVRLTVADVDRAVAWYQHALGLRIHAHEATSAELGDGTETLIVLQEDAQARPPGRHAGLYHYALRARVESAGIPVEPMDGGFGVRDPWQTEVRIVGGFNTWLSKDGAPQGRTRLASRRAELLLQRQARRGGAAPRRRRRAAAPAIGPRHPRRRLPLGPRRQRPRPAWDRPVDEWPRYGADGLQFLDAELDLDEFLTATR